MVRQRCILIKEIHLLNNCSQTRTIDRIWNLKFGINQVNYAAAERKTFVFRKGELNVLSFFPTRKNVNIGWQNPGARTHSASLQNLSWGVLLRSYDWWRIITIIFIIWFKNVNRITWAAFICLSRPSFYIRNRFWRMKSRSNQLLQKIIII